jgi:mRNA interferase MazF
MVRRSAYIPDRGDLVWVNFNPQQGHEQAYQRPAVVVSPKHYNEKSSLALMCPVTTQAKGYPFEIVLDAEHVGGVILSDQIRSLDWRARHVAFIQRIKPALLAEVQERIVQLLTE